VGLSSNSPSSFASSSRLPLASLMAERAVRFRRFGGLEDGEGANLQIPHLLKEIVSVGYHLSILRLGERSGQMILAMALHGGLR
jgi:hypothetical protein